jgi:hypothetical protein
VFRSERELVAGGEEDNTTRRFVTYITSHHITSHHITSHHITSHRIASHRIASHRIASHRIASHRIASRRVASRRITSHHITSHHITSHRIILHQVSHTALLHITPHLQSALQPLVGFRPAQPPLSILSRKVLQSAVASGTSNSQLGGEPGI